MPVETIKKRFTVEDYYRMAEAGILRPEDRVELIEGGVVEMSPMGDRHALAVSRATMIFARGLGDRAIVNVQLPVRINRYNEPQPDIALIRPRENFYGTRHPRPEDVLLLIEIADTTLQTDQHMKLPIYARSGIAEVWIIDLNNGAIHTYRNAEADTYASAAIKRRGESISPEAFPAFSVNVEDLLG
jgi:Uma2 family endonuclease